MNRHGIVNLVLVVAFLAVLGVTTGVIIAAFTVPSLTFDLVGEAGLVAVTLVWFAMILGAIYGREAIMDWVRHRYRLSDQSPDHRPDR